MLIGENYIKERILNQCIMGLGLVVIVLLVINLDYLIFPFRILNPTFSVDYKEITRKTGCSGFIGA